MLFVNSIIPETMNHFVHNLKTKQNHFQYVNWPQIANNYLVVLTSATLYILLVIIVVTKQVRNIFFNIIWEISDRD